VLEHRPFNPRTADVWALGVTLHVLLTSRLPFGGDTDVDVSEERALAMMRHGLDLSSSGPSTSVRLSAPVVELLRGLLHYVTEVSRLLLCYYYAHWRAGGVQSVAISVSVCLSVREYAHVCMSVCPHISKTACPYFTKFSGPGWDLL